MRPATEGFLRLHIVMHGTKGQLESVKNDAYKTEFATVGELIDRVNEFQPLFGPLFGDIKDELHGFTHLGKQQLIRMADGADLGPNYPDDEIVGLLKYVTLLTMVAAVSAAKFLEWPEAIVSQLLFDEFTASTKSSFVARDLRKQTV